MGKGSPEAQRRASRRYYLKNREKIRARKNAIARANPIKKDLKTIQERARSKLRYAVWTGKIIKPKRCIKCNVKGLIHGHHKDYTKPLKVEWLCTICHGLAHSK